MKTKGQGTCLSAWSVLTQPSVLMVWHFLMWNAAQIYMLRAENPEMLYSKLPFPTALFLGALYLEKLAGSFNP